MTSHGKIKDYIYLIKILCKLKLGGTRVLRSACMMGANSVSPGGGASGRVRIAWPRSLSLPIPWVLRLWALGAGAWWDLDRLAQVLGPPSWWMLCHEPPEWGSSRAPVAWPWNLAPTYMVYARSKSPRAGHGVWWDFSCQAWFLGLSVWWVPSPWAQAVGFLAWPRHLAWVLEPTCKNWSSSVKKME